MAVGVLGLALSLLGLLMTAPAAAQSGPQYSASVTGYSVGYGRSAAAEINMVRGADGVWTQARYTLPAGTLGAFAKSALRRASGAYMAYEMVKAAVEGAGWVIDELGSQVREPDEPDGYITPGNYYWGWSDPNGNMHGVPFPGDPARMCAVITKFYPRCELYDYTDGDYSAKFWITPGGGNTIITRQFTQQLIPKPGAPGRNISDSELGEMLGSHPDAATKAMTDKSGRPYDHTELRNAINAALAEWAAANGDTYTAPTLPPPPAPGTGTNPAPGTPPPQDINVEFPEFCTWASVVCDFINWYKEEPELPEPEQPEIEEQEIEASSWTSGLPSNGSCPAPESAVVGFGQWTVALEFSYDPICGLASYLRAVFIAGALAIAAFIIAGVRMRNA